MSDSREHSGEPNAVSSRAVVMGGGMAGLCAAMVLRRYFGSVIVVDSDWLEARALAEAHEESARVRRGTPQAGFQHSLLAEGWRILAKFAPELGAHFLQQGVPAYDVSGDVALSYEGRAMPRAKPIGEGSFSCSRGFLESSLRSILAADPRVQMLSRTRAEKLEHDGSRVTGLHVIELGGSAAKRLLTGDFFVCAIGGTERGNALLKSAGCGEPRVQVTRSDLNYASRFFVHDGPRPSWVQSVSLFGSKSSGMVSMLEGDRVIATASSVGNASGPTDHDGAFVEFFSGHASKVLQRCRPHSPLRRWSYPGSRFARFDELAIWPRGLVVVGDAVCRVNPILGMGMTLAARSAEWLDHCLAEHTRQSGPDGYADVAATFQRRLPDVLQEPWWLAMAHDYQNLGEAAVLLRWPDTIAMEAYRAFQALASKRPELARDRTLLLHLRLPLGSVWERLGAAAPA